MSYQGCLVFSRGALQRYYTENSKHVFPEKKLRGYSPNTYIHVSVCDLNILTIGLHILLKEKNRWTDCGNMYIYKTLKDTCMWKLGLRPRSSFSGNT